MYKYAQLKKFNCEHRLQVYMYTFVYVDPQNMPVEDHFSAAKNIVVNCNKISTK